jgi:hypothetical protein
MKNTSVSDDYTTGLLFRPITFAGWNKNQELVETIIIVNVLQ